MVAEKTAKNFRGLLYFAAPGINRKSFCCTNDWCNINTSSIYIKCSTDNSYCTPMHSSIQGVYTRLRAAHTIVYPL